MRVIKLLITFGLVFHLPSHHGTLNTIHIEHLEYKNRKRLGKFYQELNKTFNFQNGRILMALSSPSELEGMLAKDLPYLSPYKQKVEECVRESSCKGLNDLIKDIGNTKHYTEDSIISLSSRYMCYHFDK